MPGLSLHARRRIVALAGLAAVIALGWAVLGSGDGPAGVDAERESAAIRTVERFVAAASSGDFETVCSLLAPDARQVVKALAEVEPEAAGDGDGCAELLERHSAEELDGSEARVEYVNVAGPRARVEAVLRGSEAEAGNEAERTHTFMLVEGDGAEGWLIGELGE